MKASQAGKGDMSRFKDNDGKELQSSYDDLRKPCYVCGRESMPWGKIRHGNDHVCGIECQVAYNAGRFKV